MASEETIAAHLAHLRAQIEGDDYNVEYKGAAGRADPEQRGQVYEYRILTFGIDTPVTRGLKPGALDAIRAAGGELWSMFACGAGIGMFSTQLIVMTAWESERALEDAGGVVLAQFAGVVESSVERLVATIRPVGPQLQPLHLNHGTGQPCVYAHRWFNIELKDWPEVLDLSNEAWRTFETRGPEILGFWLSLDVQAPLARVFMINKYPGLWNWETTRVNDSRGGSQVQATDAKNFAARAQLTRTTKVTSTTLLDIPERATASPSL